VTLARVRGLCFLFFSSPEREGGRCCPPTFFFPPLKYSGLVHAAPGLAQTPSLGLSYSIIDPFLLFFFFPPLLFYKITGFFFFLFFSLLRGRVHTFFSPLSADLKSFFLFL